MSNEEPKKKIHRSPNYPYINLETAIERTAELWDTGKTHFVPFSAIMEAWGYKKSTTNSVIAALKAYGLVEVEGSGTKKQIKVSEDGRKIIEDHSTKDILLREAALNPPLIKELWEKYEGDLPPSDKVIAEYLKDERGFNPDRVDGFIDDFRATVKFAKLTKSDKTLPSDNRSENTDFKDGGGMQTQLPNTDSTSIPSANADNFNNTKQNYSEADLRFKLDNNRAVILKFVGEGELTQDDIEFIRAMLDVQKTMFPTQKEIDSRPKKAMWRNKDYDMPVNVTKPLGQQDGKEYIGIEGSNTGIPADEVEFVGEE